MIPIQLPQGTSPCQELSGSIPQLVQPGPGGLLKHLHDNFMEQVLRNLTWKDGLDLLPVIREDLLSKVNIGASLATETMEPLSLKSLVTGGKVPEKPQLWP